MKTTTSHRTPAPPRGPMDRRRHGWIVIVMIATVLTSVVALGVWRSLDDDLRLVASPTIATVPSPGPEDDGAVPSSEPSHPTHRDVSDRFDIRISTDRSVRIHAGSKTVRGEIRLTDRTGRREGDRTLRCHIQVGWEEYLSYPIEHTVTVAARVPSEGSVVASWRDVIPYHPERPFFPILTDVSLERCWIA